MPTLFIIRGLPGAGKSALAEMIADQHFEEDQFFMRDGEYRFDKSKLKEAYDWCRGKVVNAMAVKVEKIAVSNTFTQVWEFTAYQDLATKFGYRAVSLIVENRHYSKSIHNVPEDVIATMRNRFEIKL